MCKSEGMGLCPYGVLGQGSFQTAAGFAEREKGHDGRNFIPTSARDKQVSAVLEKIADAKSVALLGVALAYCMQKTPYVFPIVGGRKVEHLAGNIASLNIALTDAEVDEIETAYDFDHGFPHTFLSGSLFTDERPHTAANGPGDVCHNKIAEFDWVKDSKAIRPGQG